MASTPLRDLQNEELHGTHSDAFVVLASQQHCIRDKKHRAGAGRTRKAPWTSNRQEETTQCHISQALAGNSYSRSIIYIYLGTPVALHNTSHFDPAISVANWLPKNTAGTWNPGLDTPPTTLFTASTDAMAVNE